MTSYEDLVTAFERQAALHPRREAVASESRTIRYRRLDRTANRLAHWLLDRTPPGRAPVAVLAAHDTAALTILLAVIKAGKIALPLNLRAPIALQRAILEEAAPHALFVDESCAHRATGFGPIPVLNADELPSGLEPLAPDVPRDADAPAFVLFTSGSTGQPNGVLQLHRNVVANVPHQTRDLGLGCEDRVTWLAPIHVAAAPSAIFCALLNGACVLPFDVAAHSLRDLRDVLVRQRATILHTSPSLFRGFCRSLAGDTRLEHVRAVRLAGEPVRGEDVALVAKHFHPDCLLVNGFGMAETNGIVCSHRIAPGQGIGGDVVPVGHPVPGVQVHLLDDAGRPVEPGQPGEIVVESERIAPCYWNQPALDAERFTRAGPGWRFHTRDLGRALPDGAIEHLGRKDDQVKVMGHRVRLDGLEAVLLRDPELRQACVTPFEVEPGHVSLIAHVAAQPGVRLDVGALRRRLGEVLPPYSVPARFAIHEELPIAPSGKVDRRHLASLAGKAPVAAATAPSSGRAGRIAEVWSRRLGRRCAVDDASFFDLGGDSLTALEMLSEVEAMFGVNVRLAGFIEAPSVAALARLVECALEAGVTSTAPGFVSLRTSGSGRTLFLAPGAGCDPSTLLEMSGELPDDRRVLAHAWAGLDGQTRPHTTIEEMADHFVEEMRAIQPEGPHLIGGVSFGGLVAFEAARRLHAAGDPPAALVITDTRLPGSLRPRGFGPGRVLQRAVFHRNPIGATEEIRWDAVRRGLDQRRRIRRATGHARACRRRGVPIPHEHRYWDLLGHCTRVFRRWRPTGPLPGDATLLRAALQPPSDLFAVDPWLGWRRLIEGELQVVDFPGGHGDFLRAPYAAEFAGRLAKVLAGLD